jgi:uncharacterized protein YjbI with pentapeptide repeats
MRKIEQNELDKILEQHELWLNSNGKEVKRADFHETDLSDLDFSKKILRRVNFQGADLRSANLEGAILESAVLEGVNLDDANLFEANLKFANLKQTKFKGADLLLTDFRTSENFDFADFKGAKNLAHAILDESQKHILEQIPVDSDEVERLEEALNSAKKNH